MINLPFDEIIKTIVEKSSLSEDEVKKKVDDKLNQLSGLISKEGAAHIIANDLGINFSDMEKKLQISKVMPGMRNVSLVARVVQKYEKREFNKGERQGKVANVLIGDETGVTRLVMWNDQTDIFDKFSEDDTIRVTNANSRSGQNGRVELHLNDQSKVEINPEGEAVSKPPQAEINKKKISDLQEQDSNVEIMGAIVQVFDPRFFEVDPNTGRRIRPASDGKFYDGSGAEVTPDYSYVFNLFVDDGTSSIRVVCFRNQMQATVSKTHEDILGYRQDPSSFESIKNDLLGQMIKIQGRVVKNEMFDRQELIANRVYRNPDPEKEMKSMEGSGAGDNQSAGSSESSSSTSEGSRSEVSSSDNQDTSRTQSAQSVQAASSLDDLQDKSEPEAGADVDDSEVDDNLKPSEMEHDVPKEDVSFSDGSDVSASDLTDSSEEDEDKDKKQEPTEGSVDDLESLDELDELDENDEV